MATTTSPGAGGQRGLAGAPAVDRYAVVPGGEAQRGEVEEVEAGDDGDQASVVPDRCSEELLQFPKRARAE